MDKLINKLFSLFAQAWVLHWSKTGPANIGVHNTLDDLYTDLQDFIDELAETSLSLNGSKLPLPFAAEVREVPTLEKFHEEMKKTRDLIIEFDEEKDNEVYNDLFGRIVASLNHYIFMLGFRETSLKVFSSKAKDELVGKMRELFKNQNEFLVRFNSYLKSHRDSDPKVQDFFKKFEGQLIDLQTDLLKANTKLFSLREEVMMSSDESAINSYNNLVKFFDLFID